MTASGLNVNPKPAAAADELPSFRASTDYSGTQGEHNWRYQYRLFDAGDYQDLPVFAGNNWWKANNNWDFGKLTPGGVTSGSKADTARTFVAPESGSVTVSAAGTVTIHKDTYDGARLKVMKNEEQIWPDGGEWAPLNANQTIDFPALNVQVAKGDRIYFVADSGASHINGYDDMAWDPVVTYTQIIETIAPAQVTLDQHELHPPIGESATLTATIAPAEATNKNVYWTTSNPEIATVSGGVVKAVGPGTATITVTTADGGIADQATVIVDTGGIVSVYKASTGFSGVQGDGNWRYQYRAFDAEDFKDLPVFAGGSWWKSTNNWELGQMWEDGVTPGNQADTSRTFVAPDRGSAKIGAASPITIHKDTYGGARLKVMKNDEQIWPENGEWAELKSGGTIDFPSVPISVLKGDRIYFVANAGADHANGFDNLAWNPTVSYTEVLDSVSPTGVTLDRHELQPGIGESVTLHAELAPADATNPNLYWASSDPNVASVKNGVVTVIGPGTATITVTAADGGATDQAVVSVEGEGAVTRQEMIFMLAQALKVPSAPYQGIFGDVPADDTYANVLQGAYDNGIIDSHLIDSGRLRPDAPLTREETASLVLNGYDYAMPQDAPPGDIETLTDKSAISDWAVKYVQADVRLGVLYGNDPSYPAAFEPQGQFSRSEAQAIVGRLLASMDLQSMIANAVSQGKTRLVIPPNTYRIGMRGDATLIPITNAHNLEIVADGVTVVATKLTRALSVTDSSDVTIEGMTINYDPLPFTQGKVTAIAPDLSYIDVELSAGYPRQLFDRLTVYDPETKFQKHGIDFLWGTKSAWNADGTIRVSLAKVGDNVAIGDPVTLSGGQESGGIPHGISVGGSSGIVFKHVTLNTAPGMGYLEAGSEGGTVLDDFKLIPGPPPPGGTEKPLLTSVWDGLQFKTSHKGPIVENSVIQSAGDDSFSIQNGDIGVLKSAGDELVIALRDGSQTLHPGDRLKRFNTSPEAIVVSGEPVNLADAGVDPAIVDKIKTAADWTPFKFGDNVYYRIKLDRTSPFKAEDFIYTPDRMGNGFVFRNNQVYSPGRGMLLKAGDGLIENNVFRGGDKAIIVSSEGVTDTHSGAGSNLTIRNNTIIDTGYHHPMPWSEQAGAIAFSSENIKSAKAFENIVIANNTFDGVRGLNLNLTNVKNAKVTGNKFLHTHLVDPGTNGADKGIDPASVVWVRNAEDVAFSGNTIDAMGPFSDIAVNVQQPASGIAGLPDGVAVLHAKAGAPAAPAKPVLSSNSGYANGLKDGNYTVTMNLWYGNNGSVFKLFENGALIRTQTLNAASPAAQQASFDVKGKKNGTYTYTALLTNAYGSTTSAPLVVTITDAAPGAPVLAQDNWDGDGSYKVTMNLWWGTNATEYRLYENGVLIDTQPLAASTPAAQSAVTAIAGRAPGVYEYRCELVNAAGSTSSQKLTVIVKN
ncbi:Ig-like domain-containing protein [Paenibacillus sacheonensis]|uniref:SLH domain-containing protein n=1 Tax=Paenibacillus sacheonensis TaxID=742054 RepID=A0A7X4YJC4_9BACL|nr:Ig-like domain-containing protein [Paenibacillus sacheonensis]MBM7564232.1 uncharacterized protein YjdB [Paenibacillus sacheonensis]NBC67445.1 hypothetical protein [Paenibacillus sacheonensis]